MMSNDIYIATGIDLCLQDLELHIIHEGYDDTIWRKVCFHNDQFSSDCIMTCKHIFSAWKHPNQHLTTVVQ